MGKCSLGEELGEHLRDLGDFGMVEKEVKDEVFEEVMWGCVEEDAGETKEGILEESFHLCR